MRDAKGRFTKGHKSLVPRSKRWRKCPVCREVKQIRHKHCSVKCYGLAQRSIRGEANVRWKGVSAKYVSKHVWIKKNWGKAKRCEECEVKNRRMYHWANISGRYLRERTDWKELCVPCHYKFDHNREITV